MTWAFEPDPETALALARNIELNRLGNLVTVYQTALSDQDGIIAFTRGQDTTNHVADEHDRDVRIVAQTRLDSIIGQHQPIMIKVDVEGHEDAFLRGAVNTIKNSALKVIELESYGAASLANLHNAGFERVFYDPRERALVAQPIAGSKSNDIFVRDRDFVAARLRAARAIRVFGQSF